MHVLKMFAFLLLPLAVLAGANGAHEIVRTELTERIARTHKIIRCDAWQGGRRTVFDFDGHEA